MSETPAKIQKPLMRGHYFRFLRRNVILYGVLATISMPWYYYRIIRPNREKWEHFMSTIDADKYCEEIVKSGAYKNFSPDGKIVVEDDD